MKQLPVILLLGFAVSLCNLTNKLKSGSNTNAPGSKSAGSSASNGPVEHPATTAGQASALAGGQEVKWNPQGMTFTVPPKWTESENESKTLVWRSPGGSDAASLI